MDVIEFMKPYSAITIALIFIFAILMIIFGILYELGEQHQQNKYDELTDKECSKLRRFRCTLIVSLIGFFGLQVLWGLSFIVLKIVNLFIEAFS